MNKLRIVFMGTPAFAVSILHDLVEQNYNIVAVLTAPDKPAGRGRKLQQSAVKKYAIAANIPILQPTNLKNPKFIEELATYKANLQIVVAFRMLPKIVWQMPQFGTFNLHASLLPNYRGAAPINWVLINGESKTGVTTFFIDEKIDTGAIIFQDETAISPTENAGTLHDTLMHLGSLLVIKTVNAIANHTVTTTIQPQLKNLKTAYKLTKENCKIDWNASLETIYNKIRGLSPYPGAWSFLTNKEEKITVKIFAASTKIKQHHLKIGSITIVEKQIQVAVKNGFIIIQEIQLPGKRKLDTKALLNGFTFSKNAEMS